MEINIHTPHLHADVEAAEAHVSHALRHHAERLTRIDVFVKDMNADKGGVDKRCTIEARPAGLDPVAAEHDGTTAEEAMNGAAKKLDRQLEHVFGKRDHRH